MKYDFTWPDAAGLQHLRARYYNTGIGRFFQKDPFLGFQEIPQSTNPYLYAFNNPILYTDPSGESALGTLAAVFASGAATGYIYGSCSYEWALAGECGCDLFEQALSMTKGEWAGMHALMGGIIPVVYGLSAVTPITQVMVGSGLVYFSVVDFINVLEAVYDQGVGWTKCTISRAAFDVAGVIFGVKGIKGGIAKWKASGSLIKSPANLGNTPRDISCSAVVFLDSFT